MSASNSSPNEKIIFKCDRRVLNITEKLSSFYEENEFLDTVLIAGRDSVVIEAHRIVLSALSEYFLSIFRGGQAAFETNVVELKEINAPTLKLIIDFMYSGWIELSLETVESLLRTAVFLKMKTLVDGCIQFIETHISTNCLNWYRLAKELSLSGLKEKTLDYAYNHFKEVSKEKDLMLLNEEELKDLLFNDNPHGDFEEYVFLSMVAWIKHDKVNRENLTLQLLSMVRYQYLTPKFIVENRKSVCKTVDSYELICSWLQWHLSPETRLVNQQISVLKTGKIDGRLTAISCSESCELTIHTFNPSAEISQDFWFEDKVTFLSKKKTFGTMIVIDGKLIVVGGELYNRGVTNSVEYLDLNTNHWTDLPSMQEARTGCQVANLNGYLCVFGGSDDHWHFVDLVEIYNFLTHKWNIVQLPSKPNEHSKIVAHNGMLYIFDFSNGCLQSYDISLNQWNSKVLEKKELKNFGIAAVDRFVYVMGGIFQNAYVDTVRRYDLYNDTWCEVAPLPFSLPLLYTFVFENKILFCCGYSGNSILIDEYNADTNEWKDLGGIKRNLARPFCLCSISNKL